MAESLVAEPLTVLPLSISKLLFFSNLVKSTGKHSSLLSFFGAEFDSAGAGVWHE